MIQIIYSNEKHAKEERENSRSENNYSFMWSVFSKIFSHIEQGGTQVTRQVMRCDSWVKFTLCVVSTVSHWSYWVTATMGWIDCSFPTFYQHRLLNFYAFRMSYTCDSGGICSHSGASVSTFMQRQQWVCFRRAVCKEYTGFLLSCLNFQSEFSLWVETSLFTMDVSERNAEEKHVVITYSFIPVRGEQQS